MGNGKVEEDFIKLMNENKTRKEFIDKQLIRIGWKPHYWKEEVNSVKSNFNVKQYITYNGTIEKGIDRFIDYLLLAQNNAPLAIIEAKRYSKNPKVGRIQARTYQEDIYSQINQRLPIFLTNGEVWIYIDQEGRERKVSGPFSQEDLERRNELYKNRKDPTKITINEKIIDRDRSKLNVIRVLEHINGGHRQALIHMATGTGKTRVAMALIDILVKADYIRNVLFIADRIALADQASADGYKQFFREPVWEIHRKGISKTSRFYASTIQTLMGKSDNRLVDKYSPGFFDLIVFDEAHRSYYDKNGYVHQYFDAIKIGLTATPREQMDKNTYELFGCKNNEPTADYSYDEAVRDKILVPYQALVIETENLNLGITGKQLTGKLKDQLRNQEIEPEKFEVTGQQFERVFIDDKTNELIVTEFMKECYKSGEGLPCKTIFFCRSQKHTERIKQTFNKLYPSLSKQVQVIISSYYRGGDEIKRFKNKSEPRIALSVGMLDTGVDIPEVCNLVFIGPVYSTIRFWQMLGRGTRNYKACKNKKWLPVYDGNYSKKDFLLLDFQLGDDNNIKLHQLNEAKEKKTSKDINLKIFDNRINLLVEKLTQNQKKIIVNKIMNDLGKLNEESFIVREKYSLIKKLKGTFDLENYIKELREEIEPLMLMIVRTDPKVTSFIFQVEKLFYAILKNKLDLIEKIKNYVQERMVNILEKATKINEIKIKKELIVKVLQEEYWDTLTFEKVEAILRELAHLMKYYEEDRNDLIVIDKPDVIINKIKHVYKIKEDPKMIEFLKKNPIVKKIKDDEKITSRELHELEYELISINPSYTIDNIQVNLKKDFIIFLLEIIGLTQKPDFDPREIIEKEFNKHIMSNVNYNSKQIEFLILLKKVFVNRKYIELKDFAKAPFKNENPVELFNGVEELKNIVTKCQELEIL